MNDKYLAILHGICARLYNGPISDEERGKLADTLAVCLSDMVADVINNVTTSMKEAQASMRRSDEAKE